MSTDIQIATLTLTNTQVNNLVFSPQTLVPAPGANKIIIPLNVTCALIYGATFTGGTKLTVRMTSANKLWQTSMLMTPQTADLFASGALGWVGNFKPTSNYVNKSISVGVDGATNYAGGAGSSLKFTCSYYIVDV